MEYALIGALVFLVIVIAVTALSDKVKALFDLVVAAFPN